MESQSLAEEQQHQVKLQECIDNIADKLASEESCDSNKEYVANIVRKLLQHGLYVERNTLTMEDYNRRFDFPKR